MYLKNQTEFLEKLKKYEQDNLEIEALYFEHNRFAGDYKNERLQIKAKVFNEKKFKNINFESIEFEDCEFINCEFSDIDAWGTVFENCTFTRSDISKVSFFESDLINCSFNGCRATYLLFSETSLSDIKFSYCTELLELYFGGTFASNVSFINSHLSHSRFEPNLHGDESSNFLFNDTYILECYFNSNNLSKSKFENCILNKNVFSNCTLAYATFSDDHKNIAENKQFSSIDFHTINQSEKLPEDTLKIVFGITEGDVKSFTQGLSNDVVLQSVFISYSFKDKAFASRLNESLKAKGVLTFLWGNDAPGGRPLKRIMLNNVRKHDRVLFIASANSIKSEACQFELSEARKRQDIEWSTILFPIHIDSFLFEVEEHDIKPKDKQIEYWKNIQELKEINSLDFSQFNIDNFDNIKFDQAVSSIRDNLVRP
jgi:uncharacterized protein YjbI with pentapeptide repeats